MASTVGEMNILRERSQIVEIRDRANFSDVTKSGEIYSGQDGVNLYFRDSAGTEKLISGGNVTVSGAVNQLVWRPGAVDSAPVYGSWASLAVAIGENQAKNILTEVVVYNQPPGSIVSSAVDCTNVFFVGGVQQIDQSMTNGTQLTISGAGQLINPAGFRCLNLQVPDNDTSVPRILFTTERINCIFESVEFGMGPIGVVEDKRFVEVNTASATFTFQQNVRMPNLPNGCRYLTFGADNCQLIILSGNSCLLDDNVVASNGYTGCQVVVLPEAPSCIAPADQGPPQTPPVAYGVSIVNGNGADNINFQDGGNGYTLSSNRNKYGNNNPSVQGAITGIKQTLNRIYFAPGMDLNTQGFPLFPTLDAIATVVNSPDNQTTIYDVYVTNAYNPNPIVVAAGGLGFPLSGRARLIGAIDSQDANNKVLIEFTSNNTSAIPLVNANYFKNMNLEFNQLAATGNLFLWNTGEVITFEDCEFTISATCVKSPFSIDFGLGGEFRFINCVFNISNNPAIKYFGGVPGATVVIRGNGTTFRDMFSAGPTYNLYLDGDCIFTDGAIDGYSTLDLTTKADDCLYMTGTSPHVESPAFAGIVTIKEQIDAISKPFYPLAWEMTLTDSSPAANPLPPGTVNLDVVNGKIQLSALDGQGRKVGSIFSALEAPLGVTSGILCFNCYRPNKLTLYARVNNMVVDGGTNNVVFDIMQHATPDSDFNEVGTMTFSFV